MKNNTECISDDNGIEVSVNYDYEFSDSQLELGHGSHQVGEQVETDLKIVEIVIAGEAIDIINMLTKKQIKWITSKLTYK